MNLYLPAARNQMQKFTINKITPKSHYLKVKRHATETEIEAELILDFRSKIRSDRKFCSVATWNRISNFFSLRYLNQNKRAFIILLAIINKIMENSRQVAAFNYANNIYRRNLTLFVAFF